ncbi:MAG: sensor histidine kinase [Roseiflexus sp.]|nr:sensor histidine kinase [Roseiflexus sp.]MCS7289460.1 sensor histidine kinase [Roseiflexus sp.]MDW8144927.1 sensor histidine kinase [Roseiflexaceae bacterium]MDW8233833.1 sensor histidine kinase [Roseiflexaceae bacterium]
MTQHITTTTPEHRRHTSLLFDQARIARTGSSSEEWRREREQLLLLLAEREAEIRALRGMVSEARDAEQRRVVRELHDGVAQQITAACLHLQTLARLYRPRSPETRAALERAIELARCAADEVRRVIAGAPPAALDQCRLAEAIRSEAMALQRDGWQVTVQVADVGLLPNDINLALFRMAQEALQNIRQHAGRCRVQVTLDRKGSQVRLEIVDDGCGFDPQKIAAERFGLAGIRERAALLGGTVNIQSCPGCGTRIVILVNL